MVGTRADVCVYLMFYGLASNQSFRFPRCFPQRPNGNPMKARGKRYWKIRSRSEPPIRRWSEWGVVLYLERQRLKSMETLETADGYVPVFSFVLKIMAASPHRNAARTTVRAARLFAITDGPQRTCSGSDPPSCWSSRTRCRTRRRPSRRYRSEQCRPSCRRWRYGNRR